MVELSISGQRYFVCSESSSPDIGNRSTYPNSEVVGEAIIENVKYAVFRERRNGNRDHAERGRRMSDLLTKREMQIAMLVAEGKVNKQIADQLQISEWTVSTHLRRIFAKLGVNNRSAMIFRCSGCFNL